jgi:hypothetical protein
MTVTGPLDPTTRPALSGPDATGAMRHLQPVPTTDGVAVSAAAILTALDARSALARLHGDGQGPAAATGAVAAGAEDRPRVQVSTDPEAIREIAARIDAGLLPQTYVTSGEVVCVEEISGASSTVAGDEDSPLPLSAGTVRPPALAGMLAEHAYVFRVRVRPGKDAETYEEEVTPSEKVLSAALARKTWRGLPVLRGMIGAPVLRPDGTLLQSSGYDPATGLYLASKVSIDAVPDRPSTSQVLDAREFLLEVFLRDFPWRSPADKANYLALMVTQILRPFTRCLAPFAVVDATMPASGKTILTACLGMLYGQRVLTWTDSEEELRKAITSVLADQVGAVVFDNLPEGSVIDSAVLARLVTERVWADRRLGANTTASYPNDRLWLATGNNLRVGGDMASRTVWVRLDPDMPAPELRTGFALPALDQWILEPVNQRLVLWHLLVLVVDWTSAGAPHAPGPAMRQFTGWARAVGGFLAHHHVGAFLANTAENRDLDEDAATWGAFLARWHALHQQRRLSANELRKEAEPTGSMFGPARDPWDGLFPTTGAGHLPTVKSLGRKLTGQIGRWRGPYVLRSVTDAHGHGRLYWVEKRDLSPILETDRSNPQTAEAPP